MRPRWIIRGLTVLLTTAAALLLADAILGGLRIDGWRPALAAAVVLGLLNALLWPLLVRVTLPLTVITLGVFPLLLNGAMIGVAAALLPGLEVTNLWTGLVTTIVVSAVSTAVMGLLSLDDDDVWRRVVLRRAGRRSAAQITTDAPGVVFIQIDGLGHDVLRRAIRDGNAPTLAAWLRDGTHRLSRWQTDWSSQTGASQAGLLLGLNDDMPAFRWLEKNTGQVMVSNRPACAAEIERRLSTGRGLLHADGVSRGNIFTGDAVQSVFTMSVAGKRHGRIGSGYYAYFSRPYNTTRTLVASLAEIAREVVQATTQRRLGVLPRVHRGGVYPLLRTFTTVVSRDVLTATVIGDMYDGRSVVYADYVGYDEVAHHSGVERRESLEALRRLDRELARLALAAADTRRPYRIVVLSDHGQSQGATFRQRYGESLAEVISRSVGSVDQPQPTGTADESWGYAGAAVEDVGAGRGPLGRAVHRLTRHRTVGDDVLLGPEHAAARRTDDPVTVLASGNLGLVFFRHEPGRVSKERIDSLYPTLLPSLVAHPGIGFVLVDTEAEGPVVLGPHGRQVLRTGEIDGDDPLAPFGADAPTQVMRTHGFANCADIMVNSIWDPQTDEVAAFEELVGSHGGLGGEQSHPFVLHPTDLPMPAEQVLGAGALHQVFRGWLAALGHEAYADKPAVDRSPETAAGHPADQAG
ncbi:MAG TPA: phage holin family protein [Kribbella sp.]|nr:phage holin family protein [Kribbella sp.]